MIVFANLFSRLLKLVEMVVENIKLVLTIMAHVIIIANVFRLLYSEVSPAVQIQLSKTNTAISDTLLGISPIFSALYSLITFTYSAPEWVENVSLLWIIFERLIK